MTADTEKPIMPTENIPSTYFNNTVGVQEILFKDILKRIEALEKR